MSDGTGTPERCAERPDPAGKKPRFGKRRIFVVVCGCLVVAVVARWVLVKFVPVLLMAAFGWVISTALAPPSESDLRDAADRVSAAVAAREAFPAGVSASAVCYPPGVDETDIKCEVTVSGRDDARALGATWKASWDDRAESESGGAFKLPDGVVILDFAPASPTGGAYIKCPGHHAWYSQQFFTRPHDFGTSAAAPSRTPPTWLLKCRLTNNEGP